MKTGLELIALERAEQIEKHGISIDRDVEFNDMGQLKWAAQSLITGLVEDFPSDWNQSVFKKINAKSEVEKLTIAGAFIAAEIDRLNYIQGNNNNKNK
jgi:hypothetical protein